MFRRGEKFFHPRTDSPHRIDRTAPACFILLVRDLGKGIRIIGETNSGWIYAFVLDPSRIIVNEDRNRRNVLAKLQNCPGEGRQQIAGGLLWYSSSA